MQTLRLMMTADTIGGVWTYALELIQVLAPLRYEVLLATMGQPISPSQSREAARIPRLTVVESKFKLEWMDDPWEDVDASGEWLMGLAHTFRPHLVHLNTFAHGTLPWGVPTLMVGHSDVFSWWHAVKREAPPAVWATYQRRVRAGLRQVDLIAAPTAAMLTALERHYGPLGPSQVIYNARQPQLFTPGSKEQLVLTVGRVWDEAKNVAILDQIAPRLAWPIYVAGEQQHPGGGRLDLQGLKPLGQLDQNGIRAWMAKASIYALPARYEPFGLSALEAALSGCALVLGDLSSLREVWDDNARYVPPDDPDALAETLAELIANPIQQAQLAKSARLHAQRYSPDNLREAYRQVYTRLLHNLPKPVTFPRPAWMGVPTSPFLPYPASSRPAGSHAH